MQTLPGGQSLQSQPGMTRLLGMSYLPAFHLLPVLADSAYSTKMLIAFSNSKGGCSKSTLACHLAIYLFDRGVTVGFIDADPQQTSVSWLRIAEPKIRVVVATDVDAIREAKKELLRHHAIVVADSPGNGSDASYATTVLADLVLVPLQPSKPDLRAIKDSLKFVRLAQEMTGGKKPEVVLVLTFTAKGDVQTRRLRTELQEMGLPVAHSEIRRLNAFRDACDSSVTRQTSREAKEAAKDIDNLFSEVLAGHSRISFVHQEPEKEITNG